ncbi:MAG: serine--tRNA ligase, partial [Bacteroidota bacterium]
MLQVNFIRENKERVLAGLQTRNVPAEERQKVDQIIQLDDLRKSTQSKMDEQLATVKQLSGEIGKLYKQGARDAADKLKAQVATAKQESKTLGEQLEQTKQQLDELLYQMPNVPHPSVPAGNSDEDNEIYRPFEGVLPVLGEGAKPHWELAEEYDLFSLELGVKITGAGFPVFRRKGARLQRALINFFLDEAAKAGYEEIV